MVKRRKPIRPRIAGSIDLLRAQVANPPVSLVDRLASPFGYPPRVNPFPAHLPMPVGIVRRAQVTGQHFAVALQARPADTTTGSGPVSVTSPTGTAFSLTRRQRSTTTPQNPSASTSTRAVRFSSHTDPPVEKTRAESSPLHLGRAFWGWGGGCAQGHQSMSVVVDSSGRWRLSRASSFGVRLPIHWLHCL